MELLADTVFLIDLWREVQTPGRATSFAIENAETQVAINWVAAGEFLAGAESAGQDPGTVRQFLGRYPLIQSNPSIIQHYGELYARLKVRNALIGPNDLWIAATALAFDCPLVTRNLQDFNRVDALRVIGY